MKKLTLTSLWILSWLLLALAWPVGAEGAKLKGEPKESTAPTRWKVGAVDDKTSMSYDAATVETEGCKLVTWVKTSFKHKKVRYLTREEWSLASCQWHLMCAYQYGAGGDPKGGGCHEGEEQACIPGSLAERFWLTLVKDNGSACRK